MNEYNFIHWCYWIDDLTNTFSRAFSKFQPLLVVDDLIHTSFYSKDNSYFVWVEQYLKQKKSSLSSLWLPKILMSNTQHTTETASKVLVCRFGYVVYMYWAVNKRSILSTERHTNSQTDRETKSLRQTVLKTERKMNYQHASPFVLLVNTVC